MATQSLLTRLLALTEPAAQRSLLHAHSADIDNGLIDALKARADQELRADHTAALAADELLYYAAALTGDPLHRALALFAEANVCAIGGLGDYQRAIDLCDEAAAIYAHARLPVDQADAQVTKIFALAMLGRYDEALQAGAWAATVLSAHKEWLRLATIMMNVAIVYGRMGKDVEALAHFDRAGELYTLAGEEGAWSLPGVAMNRALVLRNLGRFVESLAANREAIDRLGSLGQHAEVGHAQQTMAFTYYTLGHYNEALTLLDKAERLFADDERQADLLVTALYRGHCLLEMQRYAAVIALSDSVAALAFRLQQPFEEGYALFNKALAHAGLHQATQALDLLTAARALFAQDGNLVWASEADLAAARLLLALGKSTAAHERAVQCVHHFAEHHLPLHTARAQLLVAEALFALSETVAAAQQLAAVEATLADQRLLPLAYHAAYLRGQIAEKMGDRATARQSYDQAIVHMEQLRGRLMVEHRADFLAGKERVYAAALRLALAQDEPAIAHTYADRARSRALHDLLTLRIDLR
ncbi:MAG TPA: tetratricopeptide repeat protein, partial [Caldilineaceae bacterium]|nr:tetratricopeptide repeat protein [Caldilineaceae bacterium]